MYIFYISTRAIRNFLQISRALSRNKCPRCCSADCYFIIHKPRVICSTENFRESKKKKRKKEKRSRRDENTLVYYPDSGQTRKKKRERSRRNIVGIVLLLPRRGTFPYFANVFDVVKVRLVIRCLQLGLAFRGIFDSQKLESQVGLRVREDTCSVFVRSSTGCTAWRFRKFPSSSSRRSY